MPPASLVLHFVVSEKEGAQAFTHSMETAAVLFLSELRRKKRTILETGSKKLTVVSKLHYPLWAIPWENACLILDGQGVISTKVTTHVLPDVSLFIEDIERGASLRQEFHKALNKHERSFKEAVDTVQVEFNSLVADPDLSNTILEQIRESSGSTMGDSIFLVAPKLDLQAATDRAHRVTSVRKQAQSDVKSLHYARGLLEETARIHERMIQKEIEFTIEAYGNEIANLRPETEEKVDQLLAECETRIAKMNKRADRDMKAKERQRERQERELQKLEIHRTSLLNKKEAHQRRRDNTGATHWDRLIRVDEKRIEEIKSRTHALSDLIENTRRTNETDIEKLRRGYNMLVDQERRKIFDLEEQRDRAIEPIKLELERIQILTAQISSQIAELVETKLNEDSKLNELGIPWFFDDATLVCLPFYLVCYQVEKKTKLHVLPPLRLMSSEGILKSLQKSIVSLRPTATLRFFIRPRSKTLTKMLDLVLKEKMELDQNFRESLLKAAASANILDKQDLGETLAQGIKQLKAKRWLSQKEADVLQTAFH